MPNFYEPRDEACSFCAKRAAISLDFGSLCAECRSELGILGLIWFGNYAKLLTRKTIKAIKYQGLKSIIPDITYELWQKFMNLPYERRPRALIDSPSENVCLIPIPLHRRKRLSRGYNQAELLAKALAKLSHWQVDPSLLIRKKYTASQTNLTKDERQSNLKKAFKIKGKINPSLLYVLVDDVITTGATIHSAAKMLKDNGAKRIWGICLAKG